YPQGWLATRLEASGNVLGEILGVRADVADAAGGAAALRVGTPGRLLLAGGFETRGQPALRVLDHDLANLAEFASSNHVARFFDERITGVIVRETVELAGLLDDGGEFLRLG